jgi:hypothetical protein
MQSKSAVCFRALSLFFRPAESESDARQSFAVVDANVPRDSFHCDDDVGYHVLSPQDRLLKPFALNIGAKAQPNDDPEVSYSFAAHLAYCGQARPALQMLDSAVRANYCSYPAMDSDPLLANLRGRSEFAEIRSRAIACNRRFLSETKQTR